MHGAWAAGHNPCLCKVYVVEWYPLLKFEFPYYVVFLPSADEAVGVNFNKPMIDLVREIRRRVPAQAKPGIKLANPELLDELLPVYRSSSDTVTRTLIKELYSLAGDEWSQRLTAPDTDPQGATGDAQPGDGKRYVTQVYRGQTRLVEVAPAEQPEPVETKRVYRGQVVKS